MNNLEIETDARLLIPGFQRTTEENRSALLVFAITAREGHLYEPHNYSALRSLAKEVGRARGVQAKSVLSVVNLVSFFGESTFVSETVWASVGLAEIGLLSTDFRTAIILLRTNEIPAEQIEAEVINPILRRFDNQFDIHYTGEAVLEQALGRATYRDFLLLFPLVGSVLFFLLSIVLRSKWKALIAIVDSISSVLVASAAIALFGLPIMVSSIVIPILVLVIAVADDIYSLTHIESLGDERSFAVIHSGLRNARDPVSMANLTTVVALSAFIFSGVSSLRVFGVFGLVAIIFSWLMTFTLLPALMVLLPIRSEGKCCSTRYKNRWRIVLESRRVRTWGAVFLGTCAALTLVIGFTSTRIRIDDSWVNSLPDDSTFVESVKWIEARGIPTVILTVDLEIQESDSLMSAADIVPSLLQWEDAIQEKTGLKVAVVHPSYISLAAVSEVEGIDFHKLRQMVRKRHASESIKGNITAFTQLSLAGHRALVETEGQSPWRLLLCFSADAASEVASVGRIAEEAAVITFGDTTKLRISGSAWSTADALGHLVTSQVVALCISLGVNFCILFAYWKSLEYAAWACLPPIGAVTVVILIGAAFNFPLGVANSLFLPVVVGISFDHAIHITGASSCGDFQRRAVRAVLRSTTVLAPSLLIMGFSTLPAVRQLGWMTGVGLFVSAMIAVILSKPIKECTR